MNGSPRPISIMCSALLPDSRTSRSKISSGISALAACGFRAGTWDNRDCTWRWSRRYTPPAGRPARFARAGSPTAVSPGSRPAWQYLLLYPPPECGRPRSKLCTTRCANSTLPAYGRERVRPLLVADEPARRIRTRRCRSPSELANQLDLPVLFYEGLTCSYPYASDRFHSFILEGVPETETRLAARGIGYIFYLRRTAHRSQRCALSVGSPTPRPW